MLSAAFLTDMKKVLRRKGNTLLWLVWVGWLLILFCHVFAWQSEVLFIAAVFAVAIAMYSFCYKKGFSMFRKKTQETAAAVANMPADASASTPAVSAESAQGAQSARRCTIIAQNTVFTGNTEIEGDIQVYGKILGKINLKDGILYVMRGGFMEGEFTAPCIIINGRVEGTCVSESIEIHEHGEMEGISRSGALSVRPGGSFIGQSERLAVEKNEPESERVVKIKKNPQEKPAELATGAPVALNK